MIKSKTSAREKRALPERLLRRVFEGVGAVVDRGLGRSSPTSQGGLTTSAVIQRMKHCLTNACAWKMASASSRTI